VPALTFNVHSVGDAAVLVTDERKLKLDPRDAALLVIDEATEKLSMRAIAAKIGIKSKDTTANIKSDLLDRGLIFEDLTLTNLGAARVSKLRGCPA
jgi:hypothetical protein